MFISSTLRSAHSTIVHASNRTFVLSVLGILLAARLIAIFILGNCAAPQLYEFGMVARNMMSGYGYALIFPPLRELQGLPMGGASPLATPTAFCMPGFVFVVYAVFQLFGDSLRGYVVLYGLNLVMAAVAAGALYGFMNLVFDGAAARCSAVLYAVYPPGIAATASFGQVVWFQALFALGHSPTTNLIVNQPGDSSKPIIYFLIVKVDNHHIKTMLANGFRNFLTH